MYKKDNLYRNLKKLWPHILYICTVVYLAIRQIISMGHSFAIVFSSILFVSLFLVARYWEKSAVMKYTFAYAGFALFMLMVKIYSVSFVEFNNFSFIFLLFFAYLLPDIFSTNIIGFIISFQYCNYPKSLTDLGCNDFMATNICIGYIIGVTVLSVSFSVIFRLIRNLTNDRNKFEKMCITDTLTGFSTLGHILDVGQQAIDSGNGLTVIIIDMDRFKEVNDTYGHMSGNKVLVQVADLLRKETEGIDKIIGRMGGDEYVILVKSPSELLPQHLSSKLSNAVRENLFTVDPDIDPIKLSFSVGYAFCPPNSNISIESLLNKADINMYYNKYESCKISIYTKVGPPVFSEQINQHLMALAEKDMYTYVHSKYTAQFAVEIAKELHLPDPIVEDLFLAGWLHDIGKTLISSEILRKVNELTDHEYSLIKMHVLNGINIINSLEVSETVKNAIQYHHEHWDGNGYPYKVSGKNIPLEGRILQIADAFSAMRIKRVYHKPLTLDDAVQEIQKCSGTHFDPDLVKLFIQISVSKKDKISNIQHIHYPNNVSGFQTI